MTSPTPSSVALRQPPGSPLALRSRGEGAPSPRPRSRAAEWETLFFPSGSGHSALRSRTRVGAGRGDSLRRRSGQDPPERRADGLAEDAGATEEGRLRKGQGGGTARRCPGAVAGCARPSGAAPSSGGGDADGERRFWLPTVLLRVRIRLRVRASVHVRGPHPDRDGRRAHAPAGGDRPPVPAARSEGRPGACRVRRRSSLGVRPRALPRRRGSGQPDLRVPPAGRGEPSLVSAPVGDDLGLGAVRAQDRPAAPLRRVRDARFAARRRECHAACRRRGSVPGAPLRPAHAPAARAPRRSVSRRARRDAGAAPQDRTARPARGRLGRRRRPIVRPRSCRFATTGRRSPSPTRGT